MGSRECLIAKIGLRSQSNLSCSRVGLTGQAKGSTLIQQCERVRDFPEKRTRLSNEQEKGTRGGNEMGNWYRSSSRGSSKTVRTKGVLADGLDREEGPLAGGVSGTCRPSPNRSGETICR